MLLWILTTILNFNTAFAHAPVTEQSSTTQYQASRSSLDDFYAQFKELSDPFEQSLAVYGVLSRPSQMSLYKFTSGKDGELPIEVLVPVRYRNKNFVPSYFVLAPTIKNKTNEQIDIPIPEDYGVTVINTAPGDRSVIYEPYSLERLYEGRKIDLVVKENTTYFIGVFEPNGFTGDYVLSLGNIENFENVPKAQLFKNLLKIKLGLVGDTLVPWGRIISLFILFVGLIVGLGSVTVVDVLGFLGRHDSYWLKSAISAHKITKPLIWLGTTLLFIGLIAVNWNGLFTGVALFQFITLVLMIINGAYLSYIVSPKLLKLEKSKNPLLSTLLQRQIMVSFIFSFIGWWSQLFFAIWYLVVLG